LDGGFPRSAEIGKNCHASGRRGWTRSALCGMRRWDTPLRRRLTMQRKRPPEIWWPKSLLEIRRVLRLKGAAHNPTTASQSPSLICVKTCHSLVPATANASVPICTPAGGGVIACACCCRTIVRAPMYSAIDASDTHWCQWTANSGVRCINWHGGRVSRWQVKREWCCTTERDGGD